MNIFQFIPKGRQNAILRSELAKLSGMSDRSVREEIERLRHCGNLIANMQDGKGYFICQTAEEADTYARLQDSRAKAILQPIKFFKRFAVVQRKRIEGQEMI